MQKYLQNMWFCCKQICHVLVISIAPVFVAFICLERVTRLALFHQPILEFSYSCRLITTLILPLHTWNKKWADIENCNRIGHNCTLSRLPSAPRFTLPTVRTWSCHITHNVMVHAVSVSLQLNPRFEICYHLILGTETLVKNSLNEALTTWLFV